MKERKRRRPKFTDYQIIPSSNLCVLLRCCILLLIAVVAVAVALALCLARLRERIPVDGNWLIQAHEDVTTYAGREVDFSLKVEFDANRENSILELAVGRDGTAEEVACAISCQKGMPMSDATGEQLTDGAVGGAGKTGKGRLDQGVGGHLHAHVHVGRGLLVLLGSGDIGGLGGPVLRLVVGVSPTSGSDAGGVSVRVGNTDGIAHEEQIRPGLVRAPAWACFETGLGGELVKTYWADIVAR